MLRGGLPTMRIIAVLQNIAIPVIFLALGLAHYLETRDWVLFVALGLNGVILGTHDFAITRLIEAASDLGDILLTNGVVKDATDPEHSKKS